MASGAHSMKIVVIDDDPTGSQTVHGCPLLLRWDPQSLKAGLRHPSPLLFILANTRALAPRDADRRVRDICASLRQARAALGLEGWLVVSRGDSTLRGHFPLEVEVMEAELGPFDATLLVPAFLEGGRTTVEGVHRVRGVEAHRTEFARDRLFGYRNSFLPAWVEEKSGGRISASAVERISLAELEAVSSQGDGGLRAHQRLVERLGGFQGNPVVVVDAERPEHLAALGVAVRELMGPRRAGDRWEKPRRFLFQSAASLLNGLADLPPQPLGAQELAALRRRGNFGSSAADVNPNPHRSSPLPGLVLVGSHVPLADSQLERLLEQPGCGGVELQVARLQRILEGPMPDRLLESMEAAWGERLRGVLASGRTPVFFSSRGEAACRHADERRAPGGDPRPADGQGRRPARSGSGLRDQQGRHHHPHLAGGRAAAWSGGADGPAVARTLVGADARCRRGNARVNGRGGAAGTGRLPVLTFPGNLGETNTLVEAWRWMEGMGVPV
jgi:uncharacterized protein YgbK (DUF1537 family)